MKSILPLLLIALISASTSINVNSTKENNYDEINSLQSNCSTFIRKKLVGLFPLIKKVQYFFGEGKLLQLVMMADVIINDLTEKDKQLLKKFDKLVKTSETNEIDKIGDLLEKYKINENSYKNERVSAIDNIRDDVFKNKLCRKDYEIIRDVYKQINKYYKEIKSYYEEIKNLYTKYSKQEDYKRLLEMPTH